MVKINGGDQDAAGMTLLQYLETGNYNIKRLVAEINGEIIPRDKYGQTILRDEDTVELISFVGGG